ncbi:G-type lectin S-receptor-like serine/threonine-protein kinase At1g11300 isoform X2 [Salvia splendens]|uniref:G-type lectin S-receptor-like serine/threonine-protein kinase At1g11300 isoform X2 n=1 Tax=Salvia splendens TaxID=180675 RepID=UPI001C270069|nr:G-type lectin S-receptor-like serine/threonine-protein kinase At1g11300 isoform X2 [Salvia splendens]
MAEYFMYYHLILFITYLYSCPSLSLETDRITSSTLLKDPDTITSPRNVFKFGFFSPAGTTNRYAAVFYTVSPTTIAWIANRDHPLPDSSGAATISKDGNLILTDSNNQTIWSTNATTSSPANTTLRIGDTGNLILTDDATGATLWESFSRPSNVLLPTMKIIDSGRTENRVTLKSWRSASDPGLGNFSFGISRWRIPQQFVWEGRRPVWRSGPWNGLIYLGIQDMFRYYVRGFSALSNDSAGDLVYVIPQQNVLMMLMLNASGNIARMIWDDQSRSWEKVWSAPDKACDAYGKCGPFGSCDDAGSPVCSCMRGFEPTSREEWSGGNWSSGCSRRNQLHCDGNGDGFWKMRFMKVPDFAEPFPAAGEGECRRRCLANCSCLAYAHESNIGCMIWNDVLIDVEKFNGVGVDLFIRLSASDLDHKRDKKLYIIIPVVAAFIFILFAWWWMVKSKRKAGQISSSVWSAMVFEPESDKVNTGELPRFTFEMLTTATDQFRASNLLGRGGFGPVYKGILPDGKEIAVKRLSTESGQGYQEFMNEVMLMLKLQHRNLVRLLGACVEKEEKILIYEYMPNRSLDFCLFDAKHPWQNALDWKKRFNIIEGVARGLVYLHRDSRLRIIHRDLKPSNVLLDADWNPKISDFGMARIFGGNQDHHDTARVVGTLRYMAPEYAMEGRFSEKSDVYSLGVLMLEIVKGKRNSDYYNHEWSLSLLGCAWKMWSENNGYGFGDESIASPELEEDMVRCIQIGLLCVQDSPKDRPIAQTVVSMLSREIEHLPAPKQPTLAEKWHASATGLTELPNHVRYSMSDLTLTTLQGR